MNPGLTVLLALSAMFGAIAVRVPIGVAMGLAGVAGFWAFAGMAPALSLVATEFSDVLTSNSLATIPLFLLMGGFASSAGMSRDVFSAANALVGRARGGLAMATMLGCAGFGSVCGSSLATVGAFCRISVPEMTARGYGARLATGTVAAGGTLGILIPPSVIMVIYSSLADVSLLDLFAAAILPAVLAIALHLVTIAIIIRRQPAADADALAGARLGFGERLMAVVHAWRAIALALTIFGSIYGGWYTVNEAASLGAFLAFVFALTSGEMTRAKFVAVVADVARNAAMIFTVIIGAMILSYFVSVSKAPQGMVEWVSGLGLANWQVVTVLLMIFLVLGAVFDETAAMMLTMPFVLPLVTGMGYDPVWWGIINITVIELGLLIPPIGLNVFLVRSLMPEHSLATIYAGVTPFIVSNLVRLGLLTLFPLIVLGSVKLFR